MEDIGKDLYHVVTTTFERLCFMFPAPEFNGVKNRKFEAGVSVTFGGPFRGKLRLKVTRELFLTVAANMLGQEHSTKYQRYDALGEVANVVCGNLLREIAGPEDFFRLNSPRVIETGELKGSESVLPTAEVNVTLDQGNVEAAFFIDRAPEEYGGNGKRRRQHAIGT